MGITNKLAGQKIVVIGGSSGYGALCIYGRGRTKTNQTGSALARPLRLWPSAHT